MNPIQFCFIFIVYTKKKLFFYSFKIMNYWILKYIKTFFLIIVIEKDIERLSNKTFLNFILLCFKLLIN